MPKTKRAGGVAQDVARVSQKKKKKEIVNEINR
jgi:hypothetical protein